MLKLVIVILIIINSNHNQSDSDANESYEIKEMLSLNLGQTISLVLQTI